MKLKFDTIRFRDICYAYFGWFGRPLARVFPSVESSLDAAYHKVHSEVYFSILGFASTVAFIVSFIGALIILLSPHQFGMNLNFPALIAISVICFNVPLLVGMILPKLEATSRLDGLKIEIPYASMYISVMVSGGLSPYESFVRMDDMDLLPNMQKEVARIRTIVMSTGVDPVTAMEQAAKVVNLKEYNELLLGYASSVRTGGDTLHYLFNQTESMFAKLTTRVKALGETMGMLMEAYTIIGILGVLGIFLVFVVGMSLPTSGMSVSPEQFFLFSFIVMPFLSVIFIYAGDAAQFSYPVSNWKPYIVFAGCIPFGAIIGSQLILPFFDPKFLFFPPAEAFIIYLRNLLNFAEGTEPSLGLGLTLIFIAVPSVIAEHYYAGREGKILNGITQFLRDLVEIRKSGLSPERSIEALSRRDYKSFSIHLKDISTKLNWGYPLRQIYSEFRDKVSNWLALVNIYLLIDTIEVGGGSQRSIESLAKFAETTQQLEEEKKAVLMPLIIVPYIGAALLTGTTVMFLSFFTRGGELGVSVPTVMLYKTLLTPLALHSFNLGLVTGKITSGRVSAGFKHSLFLTLVALGGIWIVSNMSIGGY